MLLLDSSISRCFESDWVIDFTLIFHYFGQVFEIVNQLWIVGDQLRLNQVLENFNFWDKFLDSRVSLLHLCHKTSFTNLRCKCTKTWNWWRVTFSVCHNFFISDNLLQNHLCNSLPNLIEFWKCFNRQPNDLMTNLFWLFIVVCLDKYLLN